MQPDSDAGKLKMARRIALGTAIVMFLIWIGGSMFFIEDSMFFIDAGASEKPAGWFIVGVEVAKAILILATIFYFGAGVYLRKRKGVHVLKKQAGFTSNICRIKCILHE
jgi:hypothetical protein